MVTVALRPSERAGLEQGVRAEKVAHGELDLVVGVVALQRRRVVEVEQVVATLLEHDDRPAGRGQDVGGGAAARTRADDDGVGARAHGWLTSSSV